MVFVGWLALGVAVLCIVAWADALWTLISAPGYGGQATDVDFAVFWGAAKLALAEGALAPFDVEKLNAARALPPGTKTFEMLWLYPPGWLLVVLPLGLLPFFWSWAVFVVGSLAIFAAATYRVARPLPGAWPLLLAAPATLITVALGQTPLIFAALLVVALEAMRRGRPLLAGLAIAAMTLKPQLGLAIPVALLAGGHWRVIFWASAFTVLIVLASLFWPGAEYWTAFFDAISGGADKVRESGLTRIMVSWYGTATMLGLGSDHAILLQVALSIAAGAAVAVLWAGSAPFDFKAAGLVFSILLISPYAIHYELVFAAVGCLYLGRAGAVTGRVRALLVLLLWLAPVFGVLLVGFYPAGPGFFFAAPLVALAFILTLSSGRRVRQGAEAVA